MKILFWQFGVFGESAIERAFQAMNIELDVHKQPIKNLDTDMDCLKTLSDYLISSTFDCVFTMDFVPLISKVCEIYKILYISWVVDSPCFPLYSKTISNSVNRIFIFDHALYQKFCQKNPKGIFYQALGSDAIFFDQYIPSQEKKESYSCDISFVGSLYTEKCFYNDSVLPPRLKGYLDGLMNAQLLVQGYNFLEDVLTLEVCNEFRNYMTWDSIALGIDHDEDIVGIVANTFLGYKVSEQDRIRTLNALTQNHSVHLYTKSNTSTVPKVTNKGYADPNTMMPYIFKCSKINLNITSKPIKTGLPLRIFDILACQGFLITNFQAEIPEYFEEGVDLVTYDSIPDLIEKVDYYLNHDEERLQIARNGYEKVKNHYSYIHCLNQMIRIAWNLQ